MDDELLVLTVRDLQLSSTGFFGTRNSATSPTREANAPAASKTEKQNTTTAQTNGQGISTELRDQMAFPTFGAY